MRALLKFAVDLALATLAAAILAAPLIVYFWEMSP